MQKMCAKPSWVSAVCFDDVLPVESIPLPIMVKIDSQGAELHVISGAPATLQTTPISI